MPSVMSRVFRLFRRGTKETTSHVSPTSSPSEAPHISSTSSPSEAPHTSPTSSPSPSFYNLIAPEAHSSDDSLGFTISPDEMDREQTDAELRKLQQEFDETRVLRDIADKDIIRRTAKLTEMSDQYTFSRQMSSRCGLQVSYLRRKIGAVEDRSEALYYI